MERCFVRCLGSGSTMLLLAVLERSEQSIEAGIEVRPKLLALPVPLSLGLRLQVRVQRLMICFCHYKSLLVQMGFHLSGVIDNRIILERVLHA